MVKVPVIIWGCGGHGREVSLVCEQSGVEVLGFLDERPEMRGHVVDGVPVLGDLTDVKTTWRDRVSLFPGGVGAPDLKRRFAEKTLALGWRVADPIVHPGASLGRASLSPGVFVGAGVIMTTNVRVGEHATINRAVNLSHDVSVGAFTTISPGAQISGNVHVGEAAYIGVNASIREKITLGDQATVGGGSFVAKDVAAGLTVGGVPARPLR